MYIARLVWRLIHSCVCVCTCATLLYPTTSTNGMIPVRWTAPEGLNEQKYSTASDVWSFGITCIEIFQDAVTPYITFTSNPAVMAMINARQVHPQPAGCSDQVYAELVRCFSFEPAGRPDFPSLQIFFARMAEHDNRFAARDTGAGVLVKPEPLEQNSFATAGVVGAGFPNSVSMDGQPGMFEMQPMSSQNDASSPTVPALQQPTLAQQLMPNSAYAPQSQASSTMVVTLPFSQPETTSASSTPIAGLPGANPSSPTSPIHDMLIIPDNVASGAHPHEFVPLARPHVAQTEPSTTRNTDLALPTNTTYSIPETREPPNAAADHSAVGLPRASTLPEATGTSSIPETQEARNDAAHTGAAPTLCLYGAVKLLPPKGVHAPALPPARVPIATASTAHSGVAGVGSEQGRPPSRTDSRSSLVNVKEGLYAIKPSIYYPVGEPHPMGSGIPGTANNPRIADQHGVASNAGDQHAHVEFGNASASATSGGQHSLENLYIATDDVPNDNSRPMERVASSGSTFIHVSQL